MNEILDEEIKDFFLFDGEKIDTLAKTNKEIKKEVKSAIFKLLQIDHVNDASTLLNKLKNDEQRSVVESTEDTNAKGKQIEIDKSEEQIVKFEEQLSVLKDEENASDELIDRKSTRLNSSHVA